jgi:quercetin dioxygenase-like cupin family protein
MVSPNFEHAIPDIPGKSLRAAIVDYTPGGAAPPRSHAKSAFIYGYVLSGGIETQAEVEPPRVVCADQIFHEVPSAHHIVSRNASATEPEAAHGLYRRYGRPRVNDIR